MFSPSEPGVRAKEGCLEEGLARCEKREESMMWTWRGEEVGAEAQLDMKVSVSCSGILI